MTLEKFKELVSLLEFKAFVIFYNGEFDEVIKFKTFEEKRTYEEAFDKFNNGDYKIYDKAYMQIYSKSNKIPEEFKNMMIDEYEDIIKELKK
jgi:hypothetical protein